MTLISQPMRVYVIYRTQVICMLFDSQEALTPDDIRGALARVLASDRFGGCPRLASFLRFVVERTLAGQAARLKGYTIGVEALGRAEGFDPQIDPIVRVEATRLRRALDDYYAGEGATDPVVIELPRGRYVPRFRSAPSAAASKWLEVLHAIQRILHIRVRIQVMPAQIARDGLSAGKGLAAGKLATAGPRLLPTAAFATEPRSADVRQDQQAQSTPAARPRRPRAGRDRGDAAHDRSDPRRL